MTDNTNILKAQIEQEIKKHFFHSRQREVRLNEIRTYIDSLPPEQQCGEIIESLSEEMGAMRDQAEKSALLLEKKLLDYGVIMGHSNKVKRQTTVQDVIDEAYNDTTSIGGITLCSISPVGEGYEACLSLSGAVFFVKESDRMGAFEILHIHADHLMVKHNSGARLRLHFSSQDPSETDNN